VGIAPKVIAGSESNAVTIPRCLHRASGIWNRSTPNPILLINQTYDPNSGYANAVHAVHYLGKAVPLTHEGYGHLSFQNPSKCVTDAMVDYLVHLITPPPGTVCPSDHKPFDPDFR
jgi:hypothetical protein